MKDELEFFDVETVPWRPDPLAPGVSERVLSREDDGDVGTRLARWAPGTETSGVIRHDYFEEVLLLEGSLHDITLDRTFRAGHFASRPPGMPHGPYRTVDGCTMLEIRNRSADAS
ncbi:cupin domain-containing protein [Kutzneria chonburiensis]|uniref:Cupin domain-containing protein n=1 Tax=Kutzneria chonburiensis TaxID=1483604 RepID=A0ABV6N5T5_9PSEU|nr:cupin domain-containing protein [Kutzneria chonburiensis]